MAEVIINMKAIASNPPIAHIIAALFAAYDQAMTIRQIKRRAASQNYHIKSGSIDFAINRGKVICAKRLSRYGRDIMYGPDWDYIMSLGADYLVSIMPNLEARIKARLLVKGAIIDP